MDAGAARERGGREPGGSTERRERCSSPLAGSALPHAPCRHLASTSLRMDVCTAPLAGPWVL